MAITDHYCLCIREMLHLLSSQLIIDFPFVHSELVNDFMRVVRFFPRFSYRRHPPFAARSAQFINFKKRETRALSASSGIPACSQTPSAPR